MLIIDFNQAVASDIELFQSNGTLVSKKAINAHDSQAFIDISSYSDGLYFARILNENQVLAFKRIIIKH
jgi:hypothetical protein